MSPRAIGLVAGREIRVRVRNKTFIWVTVVLVLAIMVGGFLISTFADDVVPSQTVGVTTETAGLGPALVSAGTATGVPIEPRTVTEAAGEDLVRDGTLDALVTGDATAPVIVVKTQVSPALRLSFAILAQQLALDEEITALGGDPAAVAANVATASLDVRALEQAEPVDESSAVTGLLGGVLIFIAITITGQLVAQGVVEEKTSRVVELLLSTIRPSELMAGKVLGIGAIGLAQLLLIAGAGLATAAATGVLAEIDVNVTATVLWVLLWFVLGYVMFSLVLAALAALVSRQEDVGSVITPVIFTMMIPYFVGVTVGVQDPGNPLVRNLSLVPFFSPFLMPIRIATGTVEGWELTLTVVLAVAILPVLVWFAGKVYGNAVLRTGARVSLRQALRGS